MASLLLEGGGERPGFWRELGAAMISPPTGFNRLVFGDRFDAVFPSRDPAIFIRLRLGATLTTNVRNTDLTKDVKRQEGSADYSITYGLPGKPGYQYKRPFDFFHFEFTAVPNARGVTDAIENVTIRGLLGGRPYDLGDELSRRLGRLRQLRLLLAADLPGLDAPRCRSARSPVVAHAPDRAAGHRAGGRRARRGRHRGDRDERDYHYGVVPLTQLGLRLIFGERAMLEATARQYYVAGTAPAREAGASASGRRSSAAAAWA